ncbi:hypothetical protein EPJ74_09595 [Brachyspira aalborgi]|uniref:PD-(D/E)XK nuclease family protein n=1 Tax=Brachyspira aalborgi TaxID=29522 RepID=A0A5C8GBY1_9SPIR|nr:PD-(D/E)XK nuclease family protein [Brachyspira aalborgi]TXJ59357.1 hypothetical protein EPJ74_09595 [Brachyspira aalborgi]
MAESLTKEENILLTLINAFKNDEKEKLNHLGNISKSLIEVRKKVKEEMEKLPPQFNILNLIRRKNSEGRLLTYEPYNSNLLYQLLNIKKKNINFVKLFLEFMNGKFENNIDLNNIIWENVEAKNEYKNIDLLIRYKKYFAVIIENKIGYHDRDRQLEKYYNTMLEEGYGNNIYIIYLTPYRDNPSENSLPEEYYKKENGKLYGKFANIKHAEIGYWLEGILKRQEFSFLNNEEENSKYNYKLLKSALIQIIDNEKSISGESEEGEMTNPKIEKVLEKELFQKIKNEEGNIDDEELQEYIDIFSKALFSLKRKKFIQPYSKFTNEVAKELEKQSYKKGDAPYKDTYYICDDNHVIKHGCHWLGLGNVFLQADWDYEKSSAKYHFGICVEENDIEMKRKIKKLKTEIKNIFYYFEYHENNNDWIFDYNQNVESDNPKEIKKIAEVMIKLNELLKKEIK